MNFVKKCAAMPLAILAVLAAMLAVVTPQLAAAQTPTKTEAPAFAQKLDSCPEPEYPDEYNTEAITVIDDCYELWQGERTSLIPLDNDLAPADGGDLKICDMGKVSSDDAVFAKLDDYSIYILLTKTNRETFSWPYWACNDNSKVQGTITVVVKPTTRPRVARVDHGRKIAIKNRMDVPIRFSGNAPNGRSLWKVIKPNTRLVVGWSEKMYWSAFINDDTNTPIGNGRVKAR